MDSVYSESLNRLIEEFGKLPGVGPKTAERLAFHILKAEPAEAMALAKAISDVKKKIKHYQRCYLPETELTFELLVAILQGLLMDVQTLGGKD